MPISLIIFLALIVVLVMLFIIALKKMDRNSITGNLHQPGDYARLGTKR
ncbi:MAG TPA: hypothetical protein VGD14_17945 [bacterium]